MHKKGAYFKFCIKEPLRDECLWTSRWHGLTCRTKRIKKNELSKLIVFSGISGQNFKTFDIFIRKNN